ncbi:MAG: L,D-transpeptidase [Candidatus Gracilibacteria bacterium]|nr:L,D-transpeptidase [Candidatus Gracilibacteria bacterium]
MELEMLIILNKHHLERLKSITRLVENQKKGRFLKKTSQDITNLKTVDRGKDNIASRILTLRGLDPANQNVENRQIYFHGTDEEFLIGQPASHGCIRMKNDDIIELFSLVKHRTKVQIA